MVKFATFSKDPKHRKLLWSKIYSRFKILIGGTLMSLAVVFVQASTVATIVLAVSAACTFYWDIEKQARYSINVEETINNLKEKVENWKMQIILNKNNQSIRV